MQPNVTVDESQFNKIQKTLKTLEKDQLVTFFKKLGHVLVNDFRMGFRKSISPDGKSWAPITHRSGRPLIDTGRLRASIQAIVGPSTLEIGTNVDYAKTQQFGATDTVQVPAHTKVINQVFGKPISPKKITVSSHSKKRNIKPRPFLGIETRQKNKIVKVYQSHIKAITSGAVQ